jgi:DnaA family protein
LALGEEIYPARKRSLRVYLNSLFKSLKTMQLTLPVALNPQLTFDNFVIADNKNLIDEVLKRNEKLEPVLYIYGENYGKTHLLQAFANKFLEVKNIIYFDLANESLENLLEIILGADVVLLDNLELANKENQKIIFDIYNNSKNNFNLIITGAKNIKNQDIFIDLKTRISQSFNLEIQGLNDDEKILALKLRAENKNIKIAGDVFKYLQKNYSRDLKKLMLSLDFLNEKSLLTKQKITKSMIKSTLNL